MMEMLKWGVAAMLLTLLRPHKPRPMAMLAGARRCSTVAAHATQ
jgi:hypothetical protein